MQEKGGSFIRCRIKIINTVTNEIITNFVPTFSSQTINEMKQLIKDVYNKKKFELLVEFNKNLHKAGDQFPIIIELLDINNKYWGSLFYIKARRQTFKNYNNEERTRIKNAINESIKNIFTDITYTQNGILYKLKPEVTNNSWRPIML